MPAATNLGNAKSALAASVTQLGSKATIDQAVGIDVQYNKAAADGMASTATADTLFWVNPYDFPVYVQSGYAVGLGTGITGDNTDYVTITIKTNDGAGGATAIALTLTSQLTDGGTWTSNQSKAFTAVTKANTAVPAGGGLWFNIAKTGAGKVVPISTYCLKLFKAES